MKTDLKKKTCLFLSEVCLLDRKSGAAQSVLTMLRALADQGWSCHAATMTLFDGDAEYSLAESVPRLDPAAHAGEVVAIDDPLVPQLVLVTASTRHRSLRPWELRAYSEMAEKMLAQLQPDIVLTYSSEALRPLLAQAQQRGCRTVFYLANAGYAMRDGYRFRFIDDYLMPSQAMVNLYRDKMGIEGRVLRNPVQQLFVGGQNLDRTRIATRRNRYVTMINPEPAKGGLFFLNIVGQAKALAPDIRFRAVESRWTRETWESKGVDLNELDSIDWQPLTEDMGRIYAESALLLVPSLTFEASSRVAAEALLAGVPVLAMNSGGLAEQLSGGGFLFDLPETLRRNFFATPEKAALQQWVKFIKVLMEDDAIYARAVGLAIKGAQLHDPGANRKSIVETFEELSAKPTLASIGSDKTVRDSLAALRKKMNQLREAVNLRLENEDADESDDLSREPYFEVLKLSLKQPALRDALEAVKAEDLDRARAILEQYLRIMPEDITALGLLADVADKQERDHEALRLMGRVVELAPGFIPGQQQLMKYLRHAGDAEAALRQSEALLKRAPHQPRYQALHASLLTSANRFEEAIDLYQSFLQDGKGQPHDWMQYALALKTLGYQQDGVDAYSKAVELVPGHGAAWHALSNMKLAVFTEDDVTLMEQQLKREDLPAEDRYNIHFTLGKAYEDQKNHAASFANYANANRIRHQQSDYDIGKLEDYVGAAKQLFTEQFFAERSDWGNRAEDPIFIVGLHRAGTTLTEQILASHSRIEGTRELPDLLWIGRDFGGIGPKGGEQGLNTALLNDLAKRESELLGQRYLDTTRSERQTNRPLFIDKMPGNWMYAGLIQLILPNARIIDIRRKPMAAGFALFKMNFGKGVDHSYDQQNIARYYMAYADLMAHFDKVLPGRIHHVQYETLVDDTEHEIRRLIDYCGVPFEEQCLRYWETERAVQTPSSEQVRKPIYRDALEQWRNYEEWLAPMREAFGDKAEG